MAGYILIQNTVYFKSIKPLAALTDGDLCQARLDFLLEYGEAHAAVTRRVAQSEDARLGHLS